MPKKIIATALTTLGIFAGMQNASADNNLFKNYAYDTPLKNYTEAAGYYDCSADVGATARCIEDVGFLDQKFTAALTFTGDKLTGVSLITLYDRDLFTRTIIALSKTFGLVSMSDGKSVLDLVELAGKSKSKDEYTARLQNYETVGLSSNDMTYTFLEGVTSFSGHTNASSLMAAVPANVRAAEFVVSGEGEESSLIIRFSLPKLDEEKALQQAKKPVESF